MAGILPKILLALVGCALIYFPITFRMMDKLRMRASLCVREMDDGLLRWIEAAAALVALEGGDAAADAYARVAEQYRKTRPGKAAEKIRLANEACALMRAAAARGGDDPRVWHIHAGLADIYGEFAALADEYNNTAKKLNDQLDTGVSGFLARAFRARKAPVLENLAELKRWD